MTEQEYKKIVEQAGGKWVGIQEGYKDIPASILFNDSKSDTLAVYVTNFSLEAVKNRLIQGGN
jgi:hypothetical protein